MFGYVKAYKPELRIKEFEFYKAVYCSLCRDLGKKYGIVSRFSLSYDFTFLALLQMSLVGGCAPTERKRCVCNPLKKCNYLCSGGLPEMPIAAAEIMLYSKLNDNIADEGFFPFTVFPDSEQVFIRMVPPGVSTVTVSPCLCLWIASPIGERKEILLFIGSAS